MLRMISVFVKGLLPDFFAIAKYLQSQKLCAAVPHRVPEPGTPNMPKAA
jgi:hypothetical protein